MRRLDAELAEVIGRAVEVRRDDAVGLLQDLDRVPSVTGEEGARGAGDRRARLPGAWSLRRQVEGDAGAC